MQNIKIFKDGVKFVPCISSADNQEDLQLLTL